MQQLSKKISSTMKDKPRIKKPYLIIPEEDISKYLVPDNYDFVNNTCPLNILKGAPSIPYHGNAYTEDVDWTKFSALFAKLMLISPGGEWQPNDCISRFSVAIMIPFQNRESNLREFLLYMHPFLQRQNINYKIYVIELASNETWNRGVLFNIGYIEAMKDKLFPCLIHHDVDSLPKYRNNIYACTNAPRLMVVFREPTRNPEYDTFLGAAVAILSDHYKLVNGYSNKFFKWGGEDDDFYNRVKSKGLQVMRFEATISSYFELTHKQAERNDKRRQILAEGKRWFHEGLNTTRYKVIRRLNESLCTRIIISLK